MFRIVSEKRGDAVTGFRVQKLGFSRAAKSEVWRNKGRRVYTVQDAQNLRTFFEQEERAVMPPVTYDEIGETGEIFTARMARR